LASNSGSAGIPYIGDHYDALGLTKDAPQEDIKRAYRKLARACHPDVAGEDPEAAKRFNRLQQAYEILSDPDRRRAYDSEGTGRPNPRRQWTDQGYRMPGGLYVRPDGGGGAEANKRRGRRGDPSNNIDLEDIFGDFGLGGSGAAPPREQAPRRGAPGAPPGGGGPRAGGQGSVFPGGTGAFADADGYMGDLGQGGGGPRPDNRGTYGARGEDGGRVGSPGREIKLTVDVSPQLAQSGGLITLEYPRLRLSEDGRHVTRYDELYDLRVPPGVRTGEQLRVPNMGDAGTDGSTGDLICELRLSPGAMPSAGSVYGKGAPSPRAHSGAPGAQAPGPRPPSPATAPRAAASSTGGSSTSGSSTSGSPNVGEATVEVPISVVEALLGGRIEVDTPAGRVRLAIPAGTSSGKRLRLREKGAGGADLYVVLQIVVPKSLDDESRALIERFAELNPDDPRASD
jgi:DnaJ-class molecular chaperone